MHIYGNAKAKFREISKFSFSSPNCNFWGKITKMIAKVNSRISPYLWFSRFPENGHSDNGYFRKNSWKPGWIRKNPRIHPSYHFCNFHSKMSISTWKWNFWFFSEFSLVMHIGTYLVFWWFLGSKILIFEGRIIVVWNYNWSWQLIS